MPAEMITIPRPAPDEIVLAAVDEAGAVAWTKVPKALAADGATLTQLVPFLHEAQDILHEST